MSPETRATLDVHPYLRPAPNVWTRYARTAMAYESAHYWRVAALSTKDPALQAYARERAADLQSNLITNVRER